MISDEDLKCYRINYEPEPYENAVRRTGDQLVVPVGAVYAIERLCNEVERLNALVKKMEAADVVKDLTRPPAISAARLNEAWDERLDDAISPSMTVIDDGA